MKRAANVTNKERLSFFINPDLYNSINQVSKIVKLSVSEIGRLALQDYIKKIENEIISKQLEEGYKANYSYYLKSNEDWKYADKE